MSAIYNERNALKSALSSSLFSYHFSSLAGPSELSIVHWTAQKTLLFSCPLNHP